MSLWLRHALLLGVAVLMLVGLVTAQTPAPAPVNPPPAGVPQPTPKADNVSGQPAGPDKAPPAEEKPAPKPDDPRDPTEPGSKIRDILNTKPPSGSTTPKGPIIVLRGRVVGHERPAMAILEVDGRRQTVTQGSIVAGSGSTTIKIVDITSNEVRVEVSPQKEVLVLH